MDIEFVDLEEEFEDDPEYMLIREADRAAATAELRKEALSAAISFRDKANELFRVDPRDDVRSAA